MADESGDTGRLVARAAQGDQASWNELLTRQRERLRRMVALRMDQRLQGRVDASDVIQEACLEAWTRLPDYVREPGMPFYLWLRFLTSQKLITLHRHHLGVHMRDAGRDVPLGSEGMPLSSSAAIAAQLVGHDPRPSEAAMREELRLRMQQALDGLEPMDREVLALRHVEQLSRAETAEVLGINESAAGKRYVRALGRLKEVLAGMPGGLAKLLP